MLFVGWLVGGCLFQADPGSDVNQIVFDRSLVPLLSLTRERSIHAQKWRGMGNFTALQKGDRALAIAIQETTTTKTASESAKQAKQSSKSYGKPVRYQLLAFRYQVSALAADGL